MLFLGFLEQRFMRFHLKRLTSVRSYLCTILGFLVNGNMNTWRCEIDVIMSGFLCGKCVSGSSSWSFELFATRKDVRRALREHSLSYICKSYRPKKQKTSHLPPRILTFFFSQMTFRYQYSPSSLRSGEFPRNLANSVISWNVTNTKGLDATSIDNVCRLQ